jgi:hypothetical protein
LLNREARRAMMPDANDVQLVANRASATRRIRMGVETGVVVADSVDAKRLGDDPFSFKGVDAKGIDQTRMGTLYAILTRTEYDPSFLLSFEYEASEDGPWVQIIPELMVALLAKMSPDELKSTGDAWFQTEEFDSKYSRWKREEVAIFLSQLRQLANQAITESKTLFMWMCL